MAEPTSTEVKKPSGLLGNLVFNIALPVLILSKLSTEEYLGPVLGLIVALAFPIGYGIRELTQSGKVNFFSVVGIISVLLTGGMSLLQLDPKYIAIKEAAIPGIIGILVLSSQYTKFHLIKSMLSNAQILNFDKLYQALDKRQNRALFEQKLDITNRLLACSFFLSSALNYGLAKWVLVSAPGTAAYNEELGKMTALSYPVIVLPMMAIMMAVMWYLFSQIGRLTGEELEEFMQ
jgi:intracellular septation protein A